MDLQGKVMLDSLVRPSGAIIDWRTQIHGISAETMSSCNFTFQHAQAAMKRLCCPNTVLIGHSLFHDLASLKMSHSRVIDTSFLYDVEGNNGYPSLRDISKAVLNKTIQVY